MRNSSLEILALTYSTHAIVLRRRDHGEWDRLYTVYTRERGKLLLLGKGTRRPKAKLASHLEPYAVTDLVLARGRAMDRITFARVVESGERFTASWESVQLAAFGAECIDRLTRDGHRDPLIFDLLRTYLATIEVAEKGFSPSRRDGEVEGVGTMNSESLRTAFSLRLLHILGYAPQLDRCLDCRMPPSPVPVVGIPERGGIICNRCQPSTAAGITLAGDDRGHLIAGSASFLCKPCTPAVAEFVSALVNHHLVSSLRTPLAGSVLTRTQVHGKLTMS
ncbi:DNA repair protein RecO [Candidatus Uhrbacteria bacterium]|nr:DNA repair protein RecO [Candidatus Uhrbacteria bacterium]